MAHILLVEDEVLVATLFQATLEMAGYRVTLANDGLEGLQADAQDPADAVVTDFRMPRMNGGEMLARLRQRRADLPAIIVTGYAGEVDLSAPYTAVVAKPVSPSELTRRLSLLFEDIATTKEF
ncbi:response regulator [Azospirillum canadense]|uniref:response regulator n=1 Tax=Azospirillum canadense TaxID=403962 RepID=UPI0022267303|nr:response regulator [Azospirillum canadense]MCW2244326.1 CheY-like chemotaxis protein [Azospirillum canadense]